MNCNVSAYLYYLEKFVIFHMTDKFLVLEPRLYLTLEKGSHVHESYEFLIPYSPMPPSMIGNRVRTFEVNKLFGINSEQSHGPAASLKGCLLLAFQADKNFLCETARMIYGREIVDFEINGIGFDSEVKNLISSFIEGNVHKQPGYVKRT